MTTFTKPVFTAAQHIAQWEERGLSIRNKEKVEHYLSVISYYRLSAYTLPFEKGNPEHTFRDNVSFDDILDLYVFDRELRLLILDAIERIEVALRSCMTKVLSRHHGAHAYEKREIFDTRYRHDWLINRIREECNSNNREVFIKHYRNKYQVPELPPVWMVMEILTFKEVSLLFTNLKLREDKEELAAFWGMHHTVLKSWFRALSDLRNVCAHHSRTWNRSFGSRPQTPRKKPERWPDLSRPLDDPRIDCRRRLYLLLVVIEYCLQIVNLESTWHIRLFELIQKHPKISMAHMGMPENWHSDPFWRM